MTEVLQNVLKLGHLLIGNPFVCQISYVHNYNYKPGILDGWGLNVVNNIIYKKNKKQPTNTSWMSIEEFTHVVLLISIGHIFLLSL